MTSIIIALAASHCSCPEPTAGPHQPHPGCRAALQFQRDVKERIAQIVTASNPQDVQGVMRAIDEQAARRGELPLGDCRDS